MATSWCLDHEGNSNGHDIGQADYPCVYCGKPSEMYQPAPVYCTGKYNQFERHIIGTKALCERCSYHIREHGEMQTTDLDVAALTVAMHGGHVLDSSDPYTKLLQEFNVANGNDLWNAMQGKILLDPSDPFDKVIIDIVSMNRKKRQDYAADGDPFSNFRDSSSNLGLDGFGPAEAAYQLLLTKVARLRSLRANGRMANTANESVMDTYLDLAVYSIIVLALVREQNDSTSES